MMINNFLKLPTKEKLAIFNAVATKVGMSPYAVEKDWWVSRTLEIVFNMAIAEHLVFKGGTSLSKAWKLINRFSEDIDLAINQEFFTPSTAHWSKKEITKLRKTAGRYTTGIFFTELKEAFYKHGFTSIQFNLLDSGDSDQDPRIIEIFYPNIVAQPSSYILPRILLEISCRSLREPFSFQQVGSLVDEMYANSTFATDLFHVPTVNPERTFLEKLFLLHEEFQRPLDKIRVNRLSRHLYDCYYLTKNGIAEKAIQDKDLYETIVSHRFIFTKVGHINYNLHNPKLLNPIPIPEVMQAWKKDYTTMKQDMIYEQNAPSFEELLITMKYIKVHLKKLNWTFSLTFPEK